MTWNLGMVMKQKSEIERPLLVALISLLVINSFITFSEENGSRVKILRLLKYSGSVLQLHANKPMLHDVGKKKQAPVKFLQSSKNIVV